MKPDLAAVQLTVRHPDANVPSVSLSGFRLRHNGTDAVVTCSHFVKWFEVQEQFDKLAPGYIAMPGSVAATASQDSSGIPDPPPFSLQLVAVHGPWDLAIFRIVEKPLYDNDWGKVVDLQHLHFATKEDRDELDQFDLWWSVGYNLDYNEAGVQGCWDRFWGRQILEVQNEICAR
ncbi:hypothetical protein PV04_02953 [Phialophora macrospora]|uniref:Uncharacterized protein n=1 Tax=Phialophora macrospora TaxID=1851006 RepID=A0A0D2GEV4_9EURO|nr:hypothetical protein PV04_02953 [Phialophora macrospora]